MAGHGGITRAGRIGLAARTAAAVVVTATLAWPMLATGQDAPARRHGVETVENRVRPGAEGTGYHLGGVELRPLLALGTIATDDLYARRDPRPADVGVTLAPALTLRHAGAGHDLALNLDALFERHPAHPAENTHRYAAAATARIEPAAQTRLSLEAGMARAIEPRGTTGDTLLTVRPIAFHHVSTAATAEQGLGPVTRLAFDLRFDRFHYLARQDGARTIALAARDYEVVAGGLRVTQAVSPRVGLFASLRANRTRYPHETPGEPVRGSNGVVALTGLAFGTGDVIEGDLAIGYLRQRFDSPRYPLIAGLAYAGNLHWHVTPLTTLSIEAGKTIQRSPIIGVAGIVEQQVVIGAAHEVLRSLVLRPRASYTVDRYRGGNRVDRFASAALAATWHAAPHLAVEASAAHALGRTSAIIAKPREYDQNRATLTLKYVF